MGNQFSAERELAQLAALRQPARLGLISKRLGRSTRCGPNLGLALGQSALRGKTWWPSAMTAGRGQPTMTTVVRDECRKICFDARPHPGLLPRGEGITSRVFDFSDDCPANPGARIFKKAARVSPSPWGEGRDEGGRETFLPR